MSLVSFSDKQVVPLRINGADQPLEPSRFIEVVNAGQGKVIHFAQGADINDANAAVDAASAAFPGWRATPHAQRRSILLKVADIFDQRATEIASYHVLETSCAESYATFLLKLTSNVIREICGSMTAALMGEVPPASGPSYDMVVKQPIGPVLTIVPWNSPTVLGSRAIASALAAGCTVVLKASELCPLTYRAMVKVFEDAGVPKGVLSQIQVARPEAASVTEALVAHPGIRKIEFIGSANVGRIIGSLGGKYLKPVLMELGGKGPAIVLKDADLKRAAELIAFGAFLHHGQICFSTERIIVERAVAEKFQQELKAEVEANHPGGVSAAVNKSGAQNAQDMLNEAKSKGASFMVGDNSWVNGAESSLKPTIVLNVPADAKMRDDETFGPSASLYVVADAAEAVKLANDSKYGLSAAVWTNDTMLALDIAKELEFGQVHINAPTLYDQAVLPIKGIKGSGWGNSNAKYGILEFVIDKTITLHRPHEEVSFGA